MSITVEKLEKTYKEKKGADVRALKGISFELPDKGMVFILGKSGCGKSTLLNILGGLDGFDGGDIVIDGKSLKDYKAKDLDGYRNEYVGFVFQENNLLEKESVRRTVALALDLQSEKDKDGRVDAVLESVELKEYADRKCNRLSGGQKQRVAIARALIKEPKLLLCDEPTGALDSETGKDIFELLKELSEKRLVVVVSHDRESAESYGDRVIELKDGEIISDSAPERATEAERTNETEKKSKKRGLSFVRAFTIGAGYIIAKPVRMVICLLLCLITFTCVGVVDTLNAYDSDKAVLYTMNEAGSKCYAFGKVSVDNENGRIDFKEGVTIEEADKLSSKLDVDRCDYIYNLGLCSRFFRQLGKGGGSYADPEGYVEADAKFLEDYGFELITGRLPENIGEIALPRYICDFFRTYGYVDGGNVSVVSSYEDMLDKTVTFGFIEQSFTVTGVIDTDFIYEKQAEVLFGGAPDYDNFGTEMSEIKLDVIHNTVFVCKGYDDYFNEKFGQSYPEHAVLRVIAPFKGSDGKKLKNIRIHTTQDGAIQVDKDGYYYCYHIANCYAKKINDAERLFSYINMFSVYAIVAAVVITVLFVAYYASGTISDKRREIGILRALGASRGDILKITACEHGIFTAVALAVSSVISTISVVVLNNKLAKGFGLGTVFIKFGIRQFAVIAAVAILAVVAGIIFPLVKLLKSKPVDVIADRK